MQGSETCLNFSHIFHIFFILCQTCEPFVAKNCQNWLLAELVVVFYPGFQNMGSNPIGGKLLLVSFALLFHRLLVCLYVTVGGGHRPPPPWGGGRVGWVGGWVGG